MNEERQHLVLLGGIGPDSHCVGLNIMRQALEGNGYRVIYLGTHNTLEEVFRIASLCNVVMVSSMDGHARHYLREFPEMMRRYQAGSPLFYLGGNLSIGNDFGIEKHFLEMGFDRVFPRFVDVEAVLEILGEDLREVEPRPSHVLVHEEGKRLRGSVASVSDDRLPESELQGQRRRVLDHWKTGFQARSLEESAKFLLTRPNFVKAQLEKQAGRRDTLLQPRAGVTLAEDQLELFRVFRTAGASVVSYQVDSLTRSNRYQEAELAVREARASGISSLNGFPVVNHGVGQLRRISSEIDIPIQTRHSTRDPRLLAEISYAGGVTAYEGGPISYNIPYFKDYPLAEAIPRWQYVDRLTALYYEQFGILLDREYFGVLTATLIPPCLAIVTGILEAILSVQQGVRSVTLGYAEQGHRVQDIAAIHTMRAMTREILSNLGYKDVHVGAVFHQYMAAFPEDFEMASDLIFESAVTGALAGADRILIKTPVEALRIPSMNDNLHALTLARRGLEAAKHLAVDMELVEQESYFIRREVQAIFDSVVMCGGGSIAHGIVKAFEKGWIDIPFAPSIHSLGRVVTARDVDGAVRFLSPGNLQLDGETREFHRHRMSRRLSLERLRRNESYRLVERDVMKVPRMRYTQWPLFSGTRELALMEAVA